jgi:hypothetical protein
MESQYNWKTYLQEAIQNGLSRSLFYKKLLHWSLGDNKSIEIRRRYFRIFVENRIYGTTQAALAASERTCGKARIGAIAQKFDYRIGTLIMEANKSAPDDMVKISLEEFFQQLHRFYLLFIK